MAVTHYDVVWGFKGVTTTDIIVHTPPMIKGQRVDSTFITAIWNLDRMKTACFSSFFVWLLGKYSTYIPKYMC